MKLNKDYLKSKAFKRDVICLGGLVLLLILLNVPGILG
jgi:hypothetical protein